MTDGYDLINLISMFTETIISIFNGIRGVSFMDTPFNLLDVYIAIMLLELIFWYILRLITSQNWDSGSGNFESEQAEYSQYGETYESSADRIDGDEILHD